MRTNLWIMAGLLACLWSHSIEAAEETGPPASDAADSQIAAPESPPRQALGSWPTYMHDNQRSGWTNQRLTPPLSEVWVYRARHRPQPAWPPPANQDFWHRKHGLQPRVTFDRAMHIVSDGRRIYFGSSADHQVRCLDLATGRQRWTFFSEAPVRLAPTWHDGRVYFGSDDAVAYCVDAADGSLVWKYAVADVDRRIPGNGQIMSTWPIRSGVLIDGDRARFAAGLFPTQGVYQVVVNAATGELLAKGELGFSPQGYMQQSGDNVMIAAGRNPAARLDQLEQPGKTGAATLGPNPPGYPFSLIGAGDLRFAGGDDQVAVTRAEDGRIVQTLPVDGKAYGLAVAGGALLVSTDQGSIHCFRSGGESGDEIGPQGSDDETTEALTPERCWPGELVAQCRVAVDRILSQTGVEHGYCLVYGSGEGCLAHELARRTSLNVVGIEPDADQVARSRRALDKLGMYGRVSIQHGSLDRTPYASAIFNLVVSETALVAGRLAGRADEVRRLVRPRGGIAFIGQPSTGDRTHQLGTSDFAGWTSDDAAWQVMEEDGIWAKYVRPPLSGAGQWTHMYAEPGNTACSPDERIAGPLLVQWFGEPGPREMIDRHHRTVPPLCCHGRLFVPGNEWIFAVDAYNGTPLWQQPIPGFRRIAALRDSGNMAATADRLYLAARHECRVLDAQTGKLLVACPAPPGPDGSPQHWGYVAVVDNLLFGSTTREGASRIDHSRAAIGNAYYDGRSMVTSTSVFACDRTSGERKWLYRAGRGAILNPTITIGGGRIYFVESANSATLVEPSGRSTPAQLLGPGAQLVSLDAATGRPRWRQDADFRHIEHNLFLLYAAERIVAVGSRNQRAAEQARPTVWYDVHAMNAADGKSLWRRSQDNRRGAGGSHGEQDLHPVIVGSTLYVEPLAYDLATGRPVESWKLSRGGHGCGTLSGCSSGLFFRAGNPAMCDLVGGRITKLTHVTRPGCWINIIPAEGLVLIPEASSGCTCNFSLQTSLALIPAALQPPAAPSPP